MNGQSSSDSLFEPENKIRILLAEYEAIERMHAHYDVINMSMTAIITAGTFTIWGMIIQTAFQQTAFQAHTPIDNPVFVNNVSALALTLFLVLSLWIRYTTIHRCIIIRKLNRSHEIESVLRMKQNSIFRDISAKRRPGGHTLELFLYFALSTFGGLIALMFQWRLTWTLCSHPLVALLLASPFMALLWMSFCKLDAAAHMKGEIEVGLPWSISFVVAVPIHRFVRWLLNTVRRKV